MPMIRVEKFGGQVPLQDDHLLAQYHAAYAENVDVRSGSMRPLTALIPIYTTADPATRSVFRIPKQSPSIDNMIDSRWLEFPNENTWVVRNPVSGVGDGGRFYWADGINPPGYTTGDRVTAGQPPLILGIPAPTVAPGVTVTGGVTPVETRAYVYTWVSQYGEEGQPSPPTVVTGNANGTWHITFTAPTVGDTTDRALATTRIYRTITNQQGVATFFFVAEIPIATLSYDDVLPDGTVALNDELMSVDWAPPLEDLNGLVTMPNGMIAGFRASEVWFCEPYRPWAWPAQFVLSVETPIVGLGVQQQSLVIMTTGWTYIATGISPDAMALTKVSNLEPCTSMGSIVSTPQGVMYTSVNGLIVVNAGVEVNGSAGLVRKDQFSKLLYLNNLHATSLNEAYFAYSAPSDGVFQPDAFQVQLTDVPDPAHDAFETIDFQGTYNGVVVRLNDERVAWVTLHSDTPVQNVLQDLWTGETMILRDHIVYHLDLRQTTPRPDYVWRSKIFQTPYKENWAAAKIFFSLPPGEPPPTTPTYFRFFADGRMVLQRAIVSSGEQFRLPSGYKSDMIQFEIQGQLEIFNVQIATSARELRQS